MLGAGDRKGGDQMTRDDALARLRPMAPDLRRQFRVRSLRLFGSTARGTAQSGSDVDLLVEFDGPADFDSFMGLKGYLEDLLGVTVDLVTEKALRAPLRPHIEQEAVRVT
jgi:uncharacterized protein